MSFSTEIPQLPEDPILSLPKLFAEDPRPHKINLGIGVYKTSEGHSFVLNCVRKAEKWLAHGDRNKDYLPIEGDAQFLSAATALLFGANSPALDPHHAFSAQTVGGSGALRVGGEFLAKLISKNLLISNPSWLNHKVIFEHCGMRVGSYPYLDESFSGIDFAGICTAIKNCPPCTIFLLQGHCHNPCGFDLRLEQWQELSHLMKKQQLIPFFDCAYQGFGDSLNEDAKGVRLFVEEGHDMLVAYSFAKNMGLYGERLGFLSLYTPQENLIPKISSQIKTLIRGNYSSPPIHPARLAAHILTTPELKLEWELELKNMRDRVEEMRNAFVAQLLIRGHNPQFNNLHFQKGLFSLFQISPAQVKRLIQENAIYLPSNGRVNIAGLNTKIIPYVAESLLSIMQT